MKDGRQEAGFIKYRWGHVRIVSVDGAGAACEYYGVVKSHYARLLGLIALHPQNCARDRTAAPLRAKQFPAGPHAPINGTNSQVVSQFEFFEPSRISP